MESQTKPSDDCIRCPECGNDVFRVSSTSIARSRLYDDGGNLEVDAFDYKDGSIDLVMCEKCNTDFDPDSLLSDEDE